MKKIKKLKSKELSKIKGGGTYCMETRCLKKTCGKEVYSENYCPYDSKRRTIKVTDDKD